MSLRIDAFRAKLDPYGVKIDSVLIEFMGFDRRSIFRPHENCFPQGYGPLRKALEERGVRLALWLALNGTGLDTEWGAQQGYERSNGPFQGYDGYFCLAGPKYKAALGESLRSIIREGNISYFKHDYQQMQCSGEAHGHPPTARHGFEANLDATLELLAYERELQPGILLNPTGYVWLSPWWLMHANYMWMGTSDSGNTRTWPELSSRSGEMLYRDGHFFKVYRKWHHQVPVSAFMTHALSRSKGRIEWNEGGDQETLREWSDSLMMIYGRGLQLTDCYLTPSILSEEFWQALGEATRWWQENHRLLENVTMVGGDPRHGQAYGYAHWQDQRAILCLRNPDIHEQTIRVPFDKSVRFRGDMGQPYRGRVIYPYVEQLPTQFASGKPLLFAVPGHTVMMVELQPGAATPVMPADCADLINGEGTVAVEEQERGKGTVRLSVQVPGEAMTRCDLLLMLRTNAKLPEFTSITVDGQPAQVRTREGAADLTTEMAENKGEEAPAATTDTTYWSIQSIDLMPFAGKTANLVATMSGSHACRNFIQDAKRGDAPFILEAWVAADRPVSASPVPPEILPPTFWHNFRRQTVCLLSHRITPVPLHH